MDILTLCSFIRRVPNQHHNGGMPLVFFNVEAIKGEAP